jgi:methionyl-tRNA synthetase
VSEAAFYVTTPIYYPNADPHIGHTYTTVVADTLARYHRLCGERTFMLTGCDQHGEKMREVARERGESPRAVADHFTRRFQAVWDELGIGYDRFIRTTDADHVAGVQEVLRRVHDAGLVYYREYEGDYCVGCERFLTERDLVDGRCRDHERVPEKRSEANYFFRMSDEFGWLADYIRRHPEFITPERYRNEALAMLRDESGLGDLSISRPKSRLDWGIELPFDRTHVCYVWFDALINYITAIGWPDAADFERLWAASEHLIGKDILKPHAVFWPIMLKAIGLPPARRLHVHGYWSTGDRKVSKSLGNVISPLVMRDRYGFDAFRYFLMREMVFGLDASFSEEAMITRINADLANNLGNLVSRSLNMVHRYCGGTVPEPGPAGEREGEVERALAEARDAVDGSLRRLEPHRALEAIFRAVDATNRYLEQREPWHAAKDPARAGELRSTLWTSCEALRGVAILLSPFLPASAAEIFARLGLGGAEALGRQRLPGDAAWGGLAPGSATTQGAPLFPRHEPPAEVG